MRLFEVDEDNYPYKKLESDNDAFPFLVDDGNPMFDYDKLGEGKTVLVNFKLSHYEKGQKLTKPIRIP